MYRLSLSPPVSGVEAGLNVDIVESHVRKAFGIADRYVDSSVGVIDGDVGELEVGHGVLIVSSDADSA